MGFCSSCNELDGLDTPSSRKPKANKSVSPDYCLKKLPIWGLPASKKSFEWPNATDLHEML